MTGPETSRPPAERAPRALVRNISAVRSSRRFVAKQRIMPVSYLRALAGGRSGDDERFCERIARRLGAGTRVIAIGRARTGIHLLAKLAVRGCRRKVLMSPYTIPDVVTMVTLAGAEPVFFDFEPDSTSCRIEELADRIDDETACVIVTHYHVNEPRLREIAELCRARGVYLFDDCAIAFGGAIGGRPLGTLTDASVFSFSSFKLLNFFWGGLITTRNPELAEALDREVAQWPRLGVRDYLFPARSCLSYDLASRPPLFEWLVFPSIRGKLRRSAQAGGLDHVRIETEVLNPTLTSRPALAAFAEWLRKIDRIDAWLERRRAIARIYRQRLGTRMVSAATPDAMLDGACFVNFPVLVPRDRHADIWRGMMVAGYDVGRSLYPNVHRHPKFARVAGRSDNVDSMVARTIYLPTHFGVSDAYAEEIAAHLAEII